jgi:hypothetical protein
VRVGLRLYVFCGVCVCVCGFVFLCIFKFVRVGLRRYVFCGVGGCVCGFVFLCVFEHLFACVCMWVFELWEHAREFGLYVL